MERAHAGAVVLERIAYRPLRGAGDTRTPMWNSAVANLVNLSVAYVAIYGLGSFAGIGVDGVSAGWIAGQGVAGFLGLRALARRYEDYQTLLAGRPDADSHRALLATANEMLTLAQLASGSRAGLPWQARLAARQRDGGTPCRIDRPRSSESTSIRCAWPRAVRR